jgi:hypothetical protein
VGSSTLFTVLEAPFKGGWGQMSSLYLIPGTCLKVLHVLYSWNFCCRRAGGPNRAKDIRHGRDVGGCADR